MPENSKPGKDKAQKKAVALQYDQQHDEAPRVVAKGHGSVAQRILEIAREHGVPIHDDSDLVEVLSKLNIKEEIPPETYFVVAEILSFVYRANQQYKK